MAAEVNQDRPPTPADPCELERWEHTVLRRRMLTGRWAPDLEARLKRALGSVRAVKVGAGDMSSNLFAQVCGTVSVLYDVPPEIVHADGFAAGAMAALLLRCGVLAQMPELQRMTIGLRDMLLRLHVHDPDPEDPGDLLERIEVLAVPTPPDVVTAAPDHRRQGQPSSVSEWRREIVAGKPAWVRETFDSTVGAWSLTTSAGDVLDGASGERYPWLAVGNRWRAIQPYVAYHATVTPALWDPYTWREIVEGSLTAGVLWSFFGHGMRNASWPQRYIVDGTVKRAVDGDGDNRVVADPAVVVEIERIESDRQPSVGQWASGADPVALLTATAEYERRLASFVVAATDILRVSGDPRSGYALALSTEGRKATARRYEAPFRRSDAVMLSTVAAMVNAVAGRELLPERGWSVRYQSLPPTEAELAAKHNRLANLVREGLLDQATAKAMIAQDLPEVR